MDMAEMTGVERAEVAAEARNAVGGARERVGEEEGVEPEVRKSASTAAAIRVRRSNAYKGRRAFRSVLSLCDESICYEELNT